MSTTRPCIHCGKPVYDGDMLDAVECATCGEPINRPSQSPLDTAMGCASTRKFCGRWIAKSGRFSATGDADYEALGELRRRIAAYLGVAAFE